jgi:hypothetical protein
MLSRGSASKVGSLLSFLCSYVRLGLGKAMHHDFAPPLDIPDNSISFIMAIAVINHMTEARALSWLEEFRRILRPGGLSVAVSSRLC